MRYIVREASFEEVSLLHALGSKNTDGWGYSSPPHGEDLLGRALPHWPIGNTGNASPSSIRTPDGLGVKFWILSETDPLLANVSKGDNNCE